VSWQVLIHKLEKNRIILDKKPGWANPYGDGHAARRMVEILIKAGFGM